MLITAQPNIFWCCHCHKTWVMAFTLQTNHHVPVHSVLTGSMEAEFSSTKSSPCNSIACVVETAKRTLRTKVRIPHTLKKHPPVVALLFPTWSNRHLRLAQTHLAAGSPVELPPRPSRSCQWLMLLVRTCPQSWGLRNPSFHVPRWNPEPCRPHTWPTPLRCPPQGSLWSWQRTEIIFYSSS